MTSAFSISWICFVVINVGTSFRFAYICGTNTVCFLLVFCLFFCCYLRLWHAPGSCRKHIWSGLLCIGIFHDCSICATWGFSLVTVTGVIGIWIGSGVVWLFCLFGNCWFSGSHSRFLFGNLKPSLSLLVLAVGLLERLIPSHFYLSLVNRSCFGYCFFGLFFLGVSFFFVDFLSFTLKEIRWFFNHSSLSVC